MSDAYWIGLSDSASEGTWRWLNGNRANLGDGSLWFPGYPRTGSLGNNNDCALAYFHSSFDGGLLAWDEQCGVNNLALCEKPV